jgi:hypothetical protein
MGMVGSCVLEIFWFNFTMSKDREMDFSDMKGKHWCAATQCYSLYVMVEYVLDRKISLHICDNVTFILNLDYAVLFYHILFQILLIHMAAVAGR